MKPFFSTQGRRLIAKLQSGKPLLAFDLDGTLVGITPSPRDTLLSQKTELLLRNLTRRYPGRVVIISGRSRADLRRRIRIPGVLLVGNHGIEGPRWSPARLDPAALKKACQRWKKQLAGALEAATGCELEDKKYTLSIHYRRALERASARRILLKAIRALEPAPRLVLGKEVFNLVPEGSPDKGTALEQLQRQKRAPLLFFVGDDWTDEDAFRLQPRHRDWITVRVGKAASKASFFIPGQEDTDRLLAELRGVESP